MMYEWYYDAVDLFRFKFVIIILLFLELASQVGLYFVYLFESFHFIYCAPSIGCFRLRCNASPFSLQYISHRIRKALSAT